jgi:hypothetical protein
MRNPIIQSCSFYIYSREFLAGLMFIPIQKMNKYSVALPLIISQVLRCNESAAREIIAAAD